MKDIKKTEINKKKSEIKLDKNELNSAIKNAYLSKLEKIEKITNSTKKKEK